MSFLQTVKSWLIPSGPKTLAEPEKELRFTRAGQAPLFMVISVALFASACALFILSTQYWGVEKPLFKGWLWVIVPLIISSFAFLRLGLHCVSHAYIILTPLGVEIFPFFQPEKNLQIIYWQQIYDAEISENRKELVLHFSKDKQSGIVASLKPIPKIRWKLLEEAVVKTLKSR